MGPYEAHVTLRPEPERAREKCRLMSPISANPQAGVSESGATHHGQVRLSQARRAGSTLEIQ